VGDALRVLAIDGGGIRGYIPSLVLAEIERRAQRPAATLFDLVVGTSTGGIIGMGLAVGQSAETLSEFYPRYGRRIFGGVERSAWQSRIFGYGATLGESLNKAATTVGAPFGGNPRFTGNARHSSDGLEGVLREVLGDTPLSQSTMDLAVTSFDGAQSIPVVFSRRDALANPSYDLPLWVVARATSAAPTYFPPCQHDWAGHQRNFVDGGVWANNPAGVALAESVPLTAARKMTGSSVLLVSLGTGVAPSGETFGGSASWIGAAGDTIKTATSVFAGELLAARALPASNYVRLQVVDQRIAGAMDDPSVARLEALKAAAMGLIQTQDVAISRLVAQLISN
jgi:uncharacterized protein